MSTPPLPIRWPAEAIWQAVEPLLAGFTVEVLPQIDSTNSELLRRFRGSAGSPPRCEPVLLVAETQTAGRGRMGRQWQSRADDSLTFSLGLPLLRADWSGLSIAVGISLVETLSADQPAGHAGQPRLGLKWPNDLWLCDAASERKLGGILVETANWDGRRYAVVGVGLNIRPQPALPDPADGAMRVLQPASLAELLPDADAPGTLLRVVLPLIQALQIFNEAGFAPFQPRFARHDVLQGRELLLSDGGQATAHGVGANGALRVHTASGMKEITSSEIGVRPLPRMKPTADATGPGDPATPAIGAARC